MDADTHLATVATAMADPARARMLCSLMDNRSRTATELAAVAEISPSTASTHLQKLERAGFIACTRAGKHRYFRLTGEDAAGAVESLMRMTGKPVAPFRPSTPDYLRFARTCYDHAAGEVAVRLHDWFLQAGWLAAVDDAYVVQGDSLATFGVDCAAASESRRRFAYPCLDWSERRHHLGGALGAAVLRALEEKGWVRREPGSRALEVTRAGRLGFGRLGVKLG